MASRARVVLRVFLLVGGVALAAVGVADGSTVDVAIGGVAAVMGAVGLWIEHRGWRPGGGPPDVEE